MTRDLAETLARFEVLRDAPYRQGSYQKRNWGHPLHSLCSYQGKLKPSLAFWLVEQLVSPGGTVLDPLGGVGTIAFEAALSGRQATTNDKSPFPALVAHAKLAPPDSEQAHAAIDALGRAIEGVQLDQSDFEAAEFGLNARVADYYHPRTLDEILKARRLFLAREERTAVEDFIWASLLHVLHGNRPYALSRNSHPITPFNPWGPAEYRPLVEHVRRRADLALKHPLPAQFVPGRSTNLDFRSLPAALGSPFDAIITSPPFLGMRFDRPNWLRLWFCGWTADDFHTRSRSFLEREQLSSLECYHDFFAVCDRLLRPGGVLLVHIGRGRTDNLAGDLREIGQTRLALVGEVVENVEDVERHGLADKGRTTHHHLLLFAK